MPPVRLVLLLVALAGGCLGAEAPPLGQGAPDAEEAADAEAETLRFANVTWSPQSPRSGEPVAIRAHVVGEDPSPEYRCEVEIAPDGVRGGGFGGSVRLVRQSDGTYACTIPGGHPSDHASFALFGRDGKSWFGSGPYDVPYSGGPGEGRPAARIARLQLEDPAPGEYPRAVVELAQPLDDNPVLETRVKADFIVLHLDPLVVSAGVLLESEGGGRFSGVIGPLPGPSEPRESGSYVVLARARSLNRLDGQDRTEWLLAEYGECVGGGCLRLAPPPG